ncbi:unnamed protein product [Boreogadus saida]
MICQPTLETLSVSPAHPALIGPRASLWLWSSYQLHEVDRQTDFSPSFFANTCSALIVGGYAASTAQGGGTDRLPGYCRTPPSVKHPIIIIIIKCSVTQGPKELTSPRIDGRLRAGRWSSTIRVPHQWLQNKSPSSGLHNKSPSSGLHNKSPSSVAPK